MTAAAAPVPSAPRRSLVAHLGTGRRAARYLKPYRRHLAGALVAVSLQAAMGVAPILIFRLIIAQLTARHPVFSHVTLIAGAALALLLLGGLLGVAASYFATRVSEGVVYDLRQRLFDHLLGQSVAYYTRERGGEVLSVLMNDVSGVEAIISQTVLDVLRNTCLLAAMAVVMLVLDWRMALATFVLVPGVGLPIRRAGRAMYRARLRVQEQMGGMTAYLQETLGLSGIMLVKAFTRQTAERERFTVLNQDLRDRQISAAMTSRWIGVILLLLQAVGPLILLLVGGYLVAHHEASLATVIAFATVAVAQFGGALQGLGSSALALAGSVAMWSRIFGMLDEVQEVSERSGAVRLGRVRGALALEDVTFSYPGQEVPALDGITAQLPPGRLVALVGPSGAGKTTLSSLSARFFDPTRGRVTLDGVDLRDLSLESLSRCIGVVFQDPFLFHTTLRENLAYGRPDASEAEMMRALANAQLAEMVGALPAGLDTVVGERGHRLSGGEKQRIAIARVLLKNPQILVLDEATAHLDTVSERQVQAALARAFVGRTSLVIAHRLSTVQAADLILVLDRGRIVESGRHEELLAADGLYARLHHDHRDPAVAAVV